MKKIVLLALLFLSAIACEEDDQCDDCPIPYVTDGIPLDQVKSSLLIHSYNPGAGYASQIPSLILEDALPGTFNSLYTVADQNSFLYSPLTDSISLNQPLEPAISFYLNDRTVAPNELISRAGAIAGKAPVATVNHVVTSNDTAWLVDSKIKFFKDTANPDFYIATYLCANFAAAKYGNALDLRVNSQADFVVNQGNVSVWDMNLPNIDSTALLKTPGDIFHHENILVKNFNEESAWGTRLSEYTPFGETFSDGDIIGTASTPIRHFFHKPDLGFDDAYEPNAPYDPTFITVVWTYNEETGRYDYVNSVATRLD